MKVSWWQRAAHVANDDGTVPHSLTLAPTRSRLALARGPSASPRARATTSRRTTAGSSTACSCARARRATPPTAARARTPTARSARGARGASCATARTACARTASSEAAAGACMPTTRQRACHVVSTVYLPSVVPFGKCTRARAEKADAPRQAAHLLWLLGCGCRYQYHVVSGAVWCVACGAVDCRGLVVAPVAGRVEIKDKKLQL